MTAALLGLVLALAESGLGLGAIVPGEMAISALAAAADGPVAILGLGTAVAIGALLGDHVGYVVGRRGGARLRGSRVVARLGVDRWDLAARLVQRHGFWALYVSRLLPVVRTVMPLVAGAAELRYRSFLAASLLGAVTWSSLWVGAGAGLAASGLLASPTLVVATVGVMAALAGVRLVARRLAPTVTFVIATA